MIIAMTMFRWTIVDCCLWGKRVGRGGVGFWWGAGVGGKGGGKVGGGWASGGCGRVVCGGGGVGWAWQELGAEVGRALICGGGVGFVLFRFVSIDSVS